MRAELTLQELARLAGVHPKIVLRFRRGEAVRTETEQADFQRIADALTRRIKEMGRGLD